MWSGPPKLDLCARARLRQAPPKFAGFEECRVQRVAAQARAGAGDSLNAPQNCITCRCTSLRLRAAKGFTFTVSERGVAW